MANEGSIYSKIDSQLDERLKQIRWVESQDHASYIADYAKAYAIEVADLRRLCAELLAAEEEDPDGFVHTDKLRERLKAAALKVEDGKSKGSHEDLHRYPPVG